MSNLTCAARDLRLSKMPSAYKVRFTQRLGRVGVTNRVFRLTAFTQTPTFLLPILRHREE